MIKTLRVNNFKVFKNMRFDFVDGLNCIIGPNGSGKSTFIDAIGFALFGPKACTGLAGDLASRGVDGTATVVLESWFPEEFTLRRGKDVKIDFNGSGKSITGARNTTKYFSDLFISWDSMLATFFARQQAVSQIVTLAPMKRRVLVASFLGLGVVSNCVNSIGSIPFIADPRKEIEDIEKSLVQLKDIEDISIESLTAVQMLRGELGRVLALGVVPEEARNLLQSANEMYATIHAQTETYSGQISVLRALKRAVVDAAKSIDAGKPRCPVCRSEITNTDELISFVDADIAVYSSSYQEYAGMEATLVEKASNLRVAANSRNVADIERELSTLPAISKDIGTLLQKITTRGTLLAQLSTHKANLVRFFDIKIKKELREIMVEFREHMLIKYIVKLQSLVTAYLREYTMFRDFSVDDNFDFMVNGYPLATYSQGQKDLVGAVFRIAAAQLYGELTFGSPAFIILDSSFDALDVGNFSSMLSLLEASPIKQVIITSHNDFVASRANTNSIKIGGLL